MMMLRKDFNKVNKKKSDNFCSFLLLCMSKVLKD